MPELPEVETIVRGLDPVLRGRRVESVWGSGLPLHLNRPVDLRALRAVAVGQVIRGVRRRGKYLLVETGDANGVVIHLGMTGRLRVQASAAARAPHTHVVLALQGGDELRFADARRFGWVEAGRPLAQVAALQALGPDPLSELDAPALADALAASRAPVKAFLLDQRRVAGLGNIYVAEALFRAGVHPATPARRVARRAPALLDAIRASLEGGIARRGTTLRDYVDADGLQGDNASALLVYGREGEPCPTCGAVIRRRVDAGRATFFCTKCQRR
ncbi:MAG TPA: bifunctional DNA-formamidopyrimidine glycosylase/DNA-(apurinic or apyrimidinic site) lyase [Polyangia bacterium]|nr:bifunctional DNA-formamidopyrimidine glycosylase/DNA-(apurinic or apyrimidinic site) lyase [Polyangia bacterium]